MSKLTKEQRDKWCARLRDPNSEQNFRSGYKGIDFHNGSLQDEQKIRDHHAMCCLVHGTYVLGLNNCRYLEEMEILIGDEAVSQLITLNDDKRLTLPQIADWIEANIQTVD